LEIVGKNVPEKRRKNDDGRRELCQPLLPSSIKFLPVLALIIPISYGLEF
jgi:hypothetical protein